MPSRRAALIGGAALVTGANAAAQDRKITSVDGSYHPANARQNSGIEGVAGVSIRMECAMRAMQGILAGDQLRNQNDSQVVKRAFEIADAMIVMDKEGK